MTDNEESLKVNQSLDDGLLPQKQDDQQLRPQHQQGYPQDAAKDGQDTITKSDEALADPACDDSEDVRVASEEIEEMLGDIKIATIGNVDAGKSTLVGVLTKGLLDDGRGKARSLVFSSGVNGHEAQNGRTSCIANEIMGWGKDGEQILEDRVGAMSVAARNAAWQKIVTTSTKTVSFLDLCGHEGYLKTTIFGLIGLCPDYGMIVVNANAGFQKMTREHLGIALALKIPIFFVITKIDIAPDNVFNENMDFLTKMLKSKAVGRTPLRAQSEADITRATQSGAIETVCPIFCVSSVTGDGLPLLRLFLRKLESRTMLSGLFKPVSEPVEFHLDHIFTVPGVGIVVSGLLRAGQIIPNQQLLLGPDKTGAFTPVRVKTIHYHRVQVDRIEAGQSGSLAITSMVKKEQLKKDSFRKGMVLLDAALKPRATWEFKAEIVILHHATTIRVGYTPVIHCGIIRQAAKVVHMSQELLRNGDKASVTFCFANRGEFLNVGSMILFREGRTKGLGRITELCGFSRPDYLDAKKNSERQS